jgi:thioredoxin-related protein
MESEEMRRRLNPRVWLLWVAVALAAGSVPARAAELVMFDSPTCVYCKRFKREAAPLYNASRAARVLPLRIVQMGRDPLGFRLKEPVGTTPTFVIVDNAIEVERFTGYSGAGEFLDMMNSLTDAYLKYR